MTEEELRERISKIEKRLAKIEEDIDILMHPFQGKSSRIFRNLNIKNISKAIVNPDADVNLTKTDVEKLKNSDLTNLEKKILLLLYENEKGLSISQLADKIDCDIDSVFISIQSLTDKGVSFISKKMQNFYVFRLDEELRELQAKENFIQMEKGIDSRF